MSMNVFLNVMFMEIFLNVMFIDVFLNIMYMNFMTGMDSDDKIMVFIILCWYWLQLASSRRTKSIRDLNSALIGHAYTQELLHGTSTQCHEMMRLSRDAYVLLCNHFKQRNWLRGSKSITIEEKLVMFLIVIGHNERFRMVKRRFQHSTETIHRCFHEVLNAMMNFATEAKYTNKHPPKHP